MNKGCKYCKHHMITRDGFEIRNECTFKPQMVTIINPVEGMWQEEVFDSCYSKNTNLDCPDFDDKPTFKEFIKMLFRRA